VGGLLYLLVQLKANRFSGGEFFFSYRYPLEALTAAAPLLALAYAGWVAHRRSINLLFFMALAISIVFQAVASLSTIPS
jgi:hypothetical protein